jgi:hypothetical protein
MSARRAFAAVALVAIVATRIEPVFLQMPFMDRGPSSRAYAEFPDRLLPQYPRFLEGVRAHTQPGDTIAISVAARETYPYAYYRASYFLTGREVVPLVDARSGESLEQNLASARYVAAFGQPAPASAEIVWSGEGGTLYRR